MATKSSTKKTSTTANKSTKTNSKTKTGAAKTSSSRGKKGGLDLPIIRRAKSASWLAVLESIMIGVTLRV